MKSSVHIVVLGDIGRSPRMKYHALSFAKEGWQVYISGYSGSRPHQSLTQNPSIEIRHLSEPPSWFSKCRPHFIVYFLKLLYTFLSLFFHLLMAPWVPVLMVQNPPAVPTLLVSKIITVIRGNCLLVDWHNYGFSIMAVNNGSNSILTKLYRYLEVNFASRFLKNESHICVSRALKTDLKRNYNILAKVLYDRPTSLFKRSTLEECHQIFVKLAGEFPEFGGGELPRLTRFTEKLEDEMMMQTPQIIKRDNRPALVVSSSSWTADDNVDLLIEALDYYDKIAEEDALPNILCVLTGRGPLKAHYQTLISQKQWFHIDIVMPWLEAEDYPLLLGASDLGICLHNSTSGLDLPMKVVDMFGAELPVCALDYPCLNELVQHNENGQVFSSSIQLANQLADLLRPLHNRSDFPDNCDMSKYRERIRDWRSESWHQNWRRVVHARAGSLIS